MDNLNTQVFVIAIIITLLFSTELMAQVHINEAQITNSTTIQDNYNEFDDWIEVYNNSGNSIDLAGYYLTDNINDLTKWQIPSSNSSVTTVPANGHLLLWADGQTYQGENHLNFNISDGETILLVSSNGVTIVSSLVLPDLSSDQSYGSDADGSFNYRIFDISSPDESNENSLDVILDFSENSRYFVNNITVTINSSNSNGVVRYTTNGSEPTISSNQYSSGLTFNSNTILKAKFFFNNGSSSATKTNRYVEMTSGMSAASSDLPIILIDTYDQILDESNMKNTFWSIIEPNNNGRAYGNDLPSYSGKTAMKIRGASSSNFTKKQWRVELRKEDDTDNKEPLLGMPSESDWVLYAPGRYDRGLINNALMYKMSNLLGYYAPRTRLVEVYYNDNGGNLDDGDYWGIYILMEKIKIDKNRLDIETLEPTENSGEDLTGGYFFSLDREEDIVTPYTINYYGSSSLGYELREPNNSEITSTQLNYITDRLIEFEDALTSADWLDPLTGYKNYTNIDSWTTTHLLRALAKEPDGFHLSSYMYKDKNKKINSAPIWDFDRAINSTDNRSQNYYGWNTGSAGGNSQGNVYYWKGGVDAGAHINQLVYDPDYETMFIDKWFNWRKNNILETNNINNLIDSLANELTEAEVRNFARWTGTSYAPRYGGFFGEIAAMKTWFEDRSVWIDGELFAPPEFLPDGGTVSLNQNITIINTSGNGSIYYTLDGSDPREDGGAISGNALIYNSNVPVTNPGITNIAARIKDGNNWSAICKVKFYVAHDYNNLVINEIHYNPKDSIYFNTTIGAMDTLAGRNFEFIEIKNTGNSDVYLNDVNFSKGLTLNFENNMIVQPDSFIVIAEDSYWFEQKYGFVPDATFSGKLENSGESIWLNDPFNSIIDTVRYNDKLPWDTIPDNGLYSLALIDPDLDNALAENWAAQNVYYSPGEENLFCPGPIFNNYIANDPSCNNYSDGNILTNTSGGDGGPYNYLWSDGSSAGFLLAQAAGTYTVQIFDNSNCKRTDTIILDDPAIIETAITKNDQFYYNTPDASATVLITSGGIEPFSYLWSDNSNSNTIQNVFPGTYTVEVTDANDCLANDMVILNAVDCSSLTAEIISIDETAYETNDGQALAVASGGYQPYNYLWNTAETNDLITGLNPGYYDVIITDNRGCTVNDSIEIIAYDCNVLTISSSKTDETYYDSNDGTATIDILTGIFPVNYQWNTGDTTSTINNLSPGNYSVNIFSADGCSLTENFTIDAIDCNLLNVTANIINETCFNNSDGNISTIVSGGNPPYNYSWNTGATTANLSNVSYGNYTVTINDILGCPTTGNFYVAGPVSEISIEETVVNESAVGASDGSIDIDIDGGTAPYNYFWSTGDTEQDQQNLTEGNYWVIVSDANGCNATKSFDVLPGSNTCATPDGISLFNITNNGLTIFWNAITNVSSFTIEYRIIGANNWISVNSSVNLFVLNNLDPCSDYELRIIGNCTQGGFSNPSEIELFSTPGCTVECDNVQNIGHLNETQQSVIIQWDLFAEAGYTLYTRKLGDSIWNENSLTFPFAILFSLTPCTTYELYVVVNCPNGFSSSGSSIYQFSTLCPPPKISGSSEYGVEEFNNNSLSGRSIKLYPNPVENLLTVENTGLKNIDFINVYNSTGQLVYMLVNEENSNSFQISTANFESGVFWLDVRYQDGTFDIEQFVKK